MKKKGIIISIIALLFVIVATIVINKNNQKYIMQDGVMLAMTLDGKEITSFPERGAYKIEIDCEDTAKGKWLVEEWKLAVEEINGNVTCNISFITNPTTLKSEVETVNTNQNYYGFGYRYSGKTPNNWVWFNNEKWRIIGSIPTCLTENCGTNTTNLIKIIRSEILGSYAYDAKASGYTGLWSGNTLYNLLNTHYYSTTIEGLNGESHAGCYSYSDSNYQPIPNCDYTEIGILSSSYYGKMIKNVYWNTGESSESVTVSTAYTNEIVIQAVSGHVGLMSISDYGFSADSSYFSAKMDSDSYAYAASTSWMYNYGYEWTLISDSDTTQNALYLINNGYLSATGASTGAAVRPVVYLDPSVYIISGDGTEGNPYQIGM